MAAGRASNKSLLRKMSNASENAPVEGARHSYLTILSWRHLTL